jgi:hypothetical protein
VVRYIHFLLQKSTISPIYVNRASSDRMQTPKTARFEASVCGQSLAGNAGSNPARGRGCLSLVSVVCLSGTGLYVGLIARPVESYQVCVCVCVCRRM